MRHLWTLIAAAVVAPLGWVLLAYGQDRSIQAFLNEDAAGAFRDGDFIRPALCLGAAGLLLGLLGTLRFSPAGAVLTGLAYTGAYLAMLVNPEAVLNFLPGRVSLAGREADLATPLRTGSALVLGAALLLAIASVSRWRGPVRADVDDSEQGAALSLRDDRPLGAEGLGLTTNPAGAKVGTTAAGSGDLFGGTPARDTGFGPPARDTVFEPAGRDVGFGLPARDTGFGLPDWGDGSDAGGGAGWRQVPVTQGWSNERPDSGARKPGQWREMIHEASRESRR